jgi:hypothetical protein
MVKGILILNFIFYLNLSSPNDIAKHDLSGIRLSGSARKLIKRVADKKKIFSHSSEANYCHLQIAKRKRIRKELQCGSRYEVSYTVKQRARRNFEGYKTDSRLQSCMRNLRIACNTESILQYR